jgi:penicillin-binding protein-related factor A (putative recombinase)
VVLFFFSFFLSFFFGGTGLNSGPHTYKAGALPLEPVRQPQIQFLEQVAGQYGAYLFFLVKFVSNNALFCRDLYVFTLSFLARTCSVVHQDGINNTQYIVVLMAMIYYSQWKQSKLSKRKGHMR